MGAALTRAEFLVGTRLGAYEIVRHIGAGATSSVFEGRHVALDKPVAVKILHENLATDPQVAARFLREGRIAAQLRHPNALDVMDLGEDRGVAYLVMELLEGQDLKAHLASVGRVTLPEAVAILLPIASALAHAHELGAVHRDVKPGNVFLARGVRGEMVPTLVDFGLSKLDGLEEAGPLTESEIVVGTLAYMAPEQTYGVANAGPPADQFALAMVLYECIVGHVPFAARTLFQLIEEIRAGVVKPPSRCVPVPPAIDDVLLRALARAPEKRWPTVRDFGAALLPFTDEATAAAWAADFGATRTRSPERTSGTELATTDARPASQPRTRPAAVTAPPLPMPAGTSPFRIKGGPYRAIALLASRIPGGRAAYLAALGDPALAAFAAQPFLASGRYDLLPIYPMTAALARVLDRPYERLMRDGSRAQARYDGKTIFQRMLQTVTPDELASRVQRYGTQYYDFGPFDAVLERPGAMLVRHAGVPRYVLPWYVPMQAAYFAELVSLLGVDDIESVGLPLERTGVVSGIPVATVSTRVTWS